MKIGPITVNTKTAKAGMTVREVFVECTRTNSPGLPVCDDHARVTGRITVKHILKRYCLPEYLVEMATILGEQISSVQDMELMAKDLLDSRIDAYIQKPHASITSASSVIKALAMMEKIDTTYLLVVDDGKYQGVITMQSLCETILDFDSG